MKKKAFTIAETLITLVIIGVVAALTIPNMIADYQKRQTVTKLKKIYSLISIALNTSMAENGTISKWELGDSSKYSTGELSDMFTKKYLLPYLKVNKYCGTSSEKCKFSYNYMNTTNKRTTNDIGSSWARMILPDGSMVATHVDKCGSYDGVNILIDTDGWYRGPNKLGRDMFWFNIYIAIYNPGEKNYNKAYGSSILLPKGYGDSRQNLTSQDSWDNCARGKRGFDCAALIIKDGWKIADDYPW